MTTVPTINPRRQFWRLYAKKAWESIPEQFRALYGRVCDEARTIRPVMGETMPWPNAELKAEYETHPTAALSICGFVLSRYGQYHPEDAFVLEGEGGWMKYVAYCDLIVRERLSLPMNPPYEDQYGIQLSVYEGLLRIEWDVRERHGGYAYLGLATEQSFARVKAERFPRWPGKDEHPTDYKRWALGIAPIVTKLKAALRPTKGAAAILFDNGFVEGHQAREKADNEPKTTPSTSGGKTAQPAGFFKPAGGNATREGY